MTSKKTKNLLFIAYFYPPLGGPAVQRPCKTIKYLTQFGWNIDVITIKDIVYHSIDVSLLSECRHRKVIRTASIDPMYLLNALRKLIGFNANKLYFKTRDSQKSKIRRLFPIDDKIGWVPFAIKAGRQALLTNKYDAIMVTGGPFSSVIAANYLSQKARIPLIIDYRDLWTLNNTVKQPQGLMYRCIQRLERCYLSKAELVLTATSHMENDLVTYFGNDLADKVMPVFSGWDEADFMGLTRQPKTDSRIIISYVGTLYGERPVKYFLKAMRDILLSNPELIIELQMVGNFYPETIDEVENSGISDRVKFIAQKTHIEAIRIMLDSDILLLIIGGVKNKWILTGKLFEYLRCQNPVIALASQNSDAAQIMRECGHQAICDINDCEAIKACLNDIIINLNLDKSRFAVPYFYERSAQVKALAGRIESL